MSMVESATGSGDRPCRFPPSPVSPPRSPEPDVEELAETLSKLNPLAEEFVPPSCDAASDANGRGWNGKLSADAPEFVASRELINGESGNAGNDGSSSNRQTHRRRNSDDGGRRRFTERVQSAQKEDTIRRTIYVSDIDQFVSEEHLAALFSTCGKVVDCRICGDPHSILRFAFIEFASGYGARVALSLGGAILGFRPLKVLPSKTAILPVNPSFLPRSAGEREMCTRTVYCNNIDKKITQTEVKNFFESFCGEVSRLRLLGDRAHSSSIAFVEFVWAESAIIALNCSGMILGDFPIRVSPSKTPVRLRVAQTARTELT